MNLQSFGLSLLLIGAISAAGIADGAIDLGTRYPATLDFSEQPQGYPWTCHEQDIWRLKEFRYALGKEFSVKAGPSQVVFGRHETSVLWAAVIPDQAGEIVTAQAGKGEHITSIWLRFHPGRVGELFPAATVVGPGDVQARPLALQVAAHKMIGSWQAGNLPMVPQRNAITIDIETREGHRRFFYAMDTALGKIEYIDAFRKRAVPGVKRIDSAIAQEIFDEVWSAFDREYAMFAIKPQVDWAKLRATYRPRAAAAKTSQELATVLAEMLDHLEDLHVYVQVNGTYVPGYQRARPLNANRKALKTLIGPITSTRHDLEWGRTSDGIGYINVYQLMDAALPETFDEVLGQMADTKGLILDLRFNGGGSEPLGCEIAGRLLDRRRVYSKSQVRTGPKHSDLGPKHERACGPAGPWHYLGPVVVLQGQKTVSSAESFALALAQCPQVTTMGDRTAGSSGNPRQVDAGAGIVVNLPRWIDMDPNGKPIDMVGIAPRVKIDAQPADFRGQHDPVLTAALERLRTAAKAAGTPGGVLQHRPGTPRPADRPKVIVVFPAADTTGVDPLTEIRIRFDRPMDPNKMGLQADQTDASNVFRLRAAPRYMAERREFVVPVLFKPGVKYRFSLQQIPYHIDFCSADGIAVRPYSWRFATREAAAKPKAARPRVVSIDPPSGAQTGMVTTIHVRFDQPMEPEAGELVGSSQRTKTDSVSLLDRGVSSPFPVAYDAATHGFALHALLPGNTKTRIELRGFRGTEGGEAEPATVEYTVIAKLYSPEQEARIAQAGRSARLREVVEGVRRTRLSMKSLEETARMVNLCDDLHDRPNWDSSLYVAYGRFGFQGDRQFYADANGVMRSSFTKSFRVGSDGQECWCFYAYRLLDSPEKKAVCFSPYEAVGKKFLTICDPFGAKRFSSAEKAIKVLRLEYLGEVKRDGIPCHRVRSWAGRIMSDDMADGFCDWLIDAQSLLPLVCDHYCSAGGGRFDFLDRRINEPIAPAMFQSPRGADIERKRWELEEGYRFLNWRACDGSGGQMHASFGESGKKGGKGGGM